MRMGFREVERRFEGTQEVKNSINRFANCPLAKQIAMVEKENNDKFCNLVVEDYDAPLAKMINN